MVEHPPITGKDLSSNLSARMGEATVDFLHGRMGAEEGSRSHGIHSTLTGLAWASQMAVLRRRSAAGEGLPAAQTPSLETAMSLGAARSHHRRYVTSQDVVHSIQSVPVIVAVINSCDQPLLGCLFLCHVATSPSAAISWQIKGLCPDYHAARQLCPAAPWERQRCSNREMGRGQAQGSGHGFISRPEAPCRSLRLMAQA